MKSQGGPLPTITFGDNPVCKSCPSGAWSAFTYGGDSALRFDASNAGPSDTLQIESVEFEYGRNLDMSTASSMTVFSPEQGERCITGSAAFL